MKWLPSRAYLHECFTYDPETGALTWKTRPRHHFESMSGQNRFNANFAGRRADIGQLKSHLRVRILNHGFLVHRVIWTMQTGEWPKQIDHKNRNGKDNRWENLREATRQQNEWNQYAHKKRELPRGVKFKRNRFYATIKANNKQMHLGVFDTPEEAREAWCLFARQQRGEFFRAD